MTIEGRWRIVEMEFWAREAIDLLGPAFFEIGPGHDGSPRRVHVLDGSDNILDYTPTGAIRRADAPA